MTRFYIVFLQLACLGVLPVLGQSAAGSQKVDSLCAAVMPKVIEWRRDIHQHPELSNREFKTAAKVAAHLKALGLDVQTNVAHTGVVGLLKGGQPGPVIALRADMDALPVTERADLPFASKAKATFNGQEVGVMHACGHDTHVAILMGVAEVLVKLRESLPGTIKFIFQPAEEGPPEGEEGGAKLMVSQGVLKNPDVEAIFGLHIDSRRDVHTIGYREGGIMASVEDFRILVKGQQTHGSQPWNGVDPIVTSAQIINSLQTIVSRNLTLTQNAAVISVGSIHGGVRSNIIPEEVELIGTIRSLDPAMRLKIHKRMREQVKLVAMSMGATAEIQIPMTNSIPVTYNDPELGQRMLPSLKRTAGADKVANIKAITGAEDFAFYAQEIPGFFFFIGGKPLDVPLEKSPAHHTPDFFIDESGLALGVRAMTNLALDYLNR